MSARYPPVAIAILNWNGSHFLQTLLPLLQQLTYPDCTVYVIDNSSTDDSVNVLQSAFPWVKAILLDDNYGFAEGYNRGLQQVEEELYLILNSDVEMPAGFLEPLVEMIMRNEQIAVCQPKILSLKQPAFFEHAGAAGGMIDMLGYPFCRGRIFDTVEKDTGQYNDEATVFWASGTCCLVKKEVYRQVGGMYNYFFMHMEEIDMCWRLSSLGYKVMYCPQSVVYHLGGGSLSYQSPRKTYLNFRNNLVMCCRNSPGYVFAGLFIVRLCLDAVAALQMLFTKNAAGAKAVAAAYAAFFKWLLKKDAFKFPAKKKALASIPGCSKLSIVWSYYIRKRKTYTAFDKAVKKE